VLHGEFEKTANSQMENSIFLDRMIELRKYRGFIVGSIRRDFQSRYQNSILGAMWAILNPLAMIMVYTVVFSQIMKTRLPGLDNGFGYSIYLCAGIFTWGLFQEILTKSSSMFLDNSHLLKKLRFPKICLPIIIVGSASLNFLIIFSLFTLFLVVSGSFPGVSFVALLPVLLLLITFATGLGLIVGVLNVFFRDVGHAFGVLLQFWFWLTPIVYPLGALPERYQSLLMINPMTTIVMACQRILTSGQWPNWERLGVAAVLSLLLCALGLSLLRRHAAELMDEL